MRDRAKTNTNLLGPLDRTGALASAAAGMREGEREGERERGRERTREKERKREREREGNTMLERDWKREDGEED